MGIPAWPTNLPPLMGELGTDSTGQLVVPPREVTFDDGPVRTRRETLVVTVPRTITLPPLSRAQLAIFLAFLRTDLNGGTRRFTAPVRQPDGHLGTRTCKMTGKVSESDLGAASQVSFTVLIYDW